MAFFTRRDNFDCCSPSFTDTNTIHCCTGTGDRGPADEKEKEDTTWQGYSVPLTAAAAAVLFCPDAGWCAREWISNPSQCGNAFHSVRRRRLIAVVSCYFPVLQLICGNDDTEKREKRGWTVCSTICLHINRYIEPQWISIIRGGGESNQEEQQIRPTDRTNDRSPSYTGIQQQQLHPSSGYKVWLLVKWTRMKT